MPYVICNEENNLYLFAGKGSQTLVSGIENATTWSKINTANNVLKNISKILSSQNLKVKYVAQKNNIVSEPAMPNELDYDILEKVNEIGSLARKAEHRKVYLLEKIQMIDLEIVDIEHAAEFYNLNASQGYQLYKMLHDARVKRRELKNELEKISLFLGTTISSDKMENLSKGIIGMDNRKYTPRVNKELFGV